MDQPIGRIADELGYAAFPNLFQVIPGPNEVLRECLHCTTISSSTLFPNLHQTP